MLLDRDSPSYPLELRSNDGLETMRKAVLLRVGVDAGCGGIQGPLFEDGSFEFVCIPQPRG
jgi:hypothetical protein